jgi:ParB-like chromosome segregation protein Spo0J
VLRKITVKDIRPNPFQHRRTRSDETIQSLADEIAKMGLWAGALRGRENNGHVELCFGHRRLDAIKKLGWKEVDVDVVKLTDEDMALQALVENLQREGLNDADKGEGIAAWIRLKTGLVEIPKAPVGGNMRPEKLPKNLRITLQAKKEIASILGIDATRVNELIDIAVELTEEEKQPIREGKLAGGAVLYAKRLGKEHDESAMVDAAVKHKVGKNALGGIDRELRKVTNKTIKKKVLKAFSEGKVKSGDDVAAKAAHFSGQQHAKEWQKKVPDLKDVMRVWTERAHEWCGQLEEVLPYMDYIDQEPMLAKLWKEAVLALIAQLEKFK